MLQVIIFSSIAGICGTGLGGLISAILFRKPSDTTTCLLLSFAGGVMTSIVCFGLLPEAFALVPVGIVVAGIIGGIAVIMVLSRIVDKLTLMKDEELKLHHTPEELYHESSIIQRKSSMLRSGFLMLTAIALHNIPEGIAIGAGTSHDLRMGFLLVIMIALHNIPEGMAISAPLLAGGVKHKKVIWLTALSGAPTLLGGIGGMLIGSISDTAIALSLAAAGGAMLYIVFGEIIPQSSVMTRDRRGSIATLCGILVGLLAAQL